MRLSPGSRLGVYEVAAPIGEGGMGEVYPRADTKLKREVAIKVLPRVASPPTPTGSRASSARRSCSPRSTIPTSPAIYGFEESGGVSALVMELVEGEDLSQRLARGALPLDEALPIADQIADALDAAHERGIMHRDLKPANIKLRADGTVKVLDFGLAKMFDRRAAAAPSPADGATISSPATMTSAGMVLGTAAYMSPEQARGQTVDARTDLWAFGCVLFEMLTGTRAFPGDTVTDILAAVVKEEPRWHDLPAATPAAIQRLLRRCLTKDRKRRLASAADARLDIEEALDPGRADPTPTAPRTSRRSPWIFAIGLGTVVAAIAGAYLLGSRAATVRSTPAPATRFVIPAPPGTQIVSGHREVALSADGRQVAFIARGAADQHIYVRRLTTGTATRSPGPKGRAT